MSEIQELEAQRVAHAESRIDAMIKVYASKQPEGAYERSVCDWYEAVRTWRKYGMGSQMPRAPIGDWELRNEQ